MRTIPTRALALALTTMLVALLGTATALADPASLYRGPGPRPGPAVLYDPPASAPQFTNTGPWQAAPLLVSGASAYRNGEYVYQDFLYDDHGANSGVRDPRDPRQGAGTASESFSAPNGTYSYPTDGVYAMNAADLVELRTRPLPTATAFRITLNTMKDPARVGTTIAIGSSPTPQLFPHGANVSAPAQYFLTVHGGAAELVDATTKLPLPGPAPTVSTDVARRQIEVTVPHAAWNPGTSTVRLAAGVGLWNTATDAYLTPQPSADASHPGGSGALPTPPAFFNVAFRHNPRDGRVDPGDEPFPTPSDSSAVSDPAWWRDRAQGAALRTGDLSAFHDDVDFGRLAAGANDELTGEHRGAPLDGPIDRILASHAETEQGVDFQKLCTNPNECQGEYRGRLQPYSIYVPRRPQPAQGWGMTLLLHSLGANYNQYHSSRNQAQFGERGPGSITITPEGRGTDGWYYDHAGADTFEAWADVAAHYRLDPAFTSITGYSMGGYGTYKFATQYPDLFAKGQPTVGPPGLGVWAPPADPVPGGASSLTFRQLASLRNVPFLIWVASSDDLVPYPGPQAQARGFDGLGYRYAFDTFSPAEHLTLAVNDQYQPAADFLGTTKVDRDPPHVTYVVNPKMDFPNVRTVADHAYWLSGLRLRSGAGAAPLGTIDVRSHGFGLGDPPAGSTKTGGGVLTGGTLPALSFTEQSKDWGAAPREAVENRLDIDARNVSSLTVNPARARVRCDAGLNVSSDGPVTVTLAGCNRSESFGASSATCARRTPRSSISRSTLRASRRRGLRVSGRAIGVRCAGRRGTIRRVTISVARRSGKRCRFLSRSGRLGSRRACSRPVALAAHLGRTRRGKVAWTFRSRRARLPGGRYVIRARATDRRGVGETRRRRYNEKSLKAR